MLRRLSRDIDRLNRQGMIERWNAAHWCGVEAAMASGTTRLHGRPTLIRDQHKSGSRLYVEMSFAFVADGAGAVLDPVAIATERMERERMATKGVAQGKT